MQARFKTREHFLEWRSHWRREYKSVSATIHAFKADARSPTNNSERQKAAQSGLRHAQTTARSLMIARAFTDALYARDKARLGNAPGKGISIEPPETV